MTTSTEPTAPHRTRARDRTARSGCRPHPPSTSPRCSAPACSCSPASPPTSPAPPRSSRVAAVLLLSIPLASTFAALAARYPDAGGVATFVRLALGDTAARASGYWFFFGVGFGAPVVAALGGEYLVAALGADHSLVPFIGIGFLAATLGLAAFGLRVSGVGAARADGAARRGRRARRRLVGLGLRPGELRAVPAARLGRRRDRRQPVRLGLRRLGGGDPHRRRVQESAPHHPARHGDRDRRRRGRLPRAAVRDGRRARRDRRQQRRAAHRPRRGHAARRRADHRRGHRRRRRGRRAQRLRARVRQPRRLARPRRPPAALVREGRRAGRGAAPRARRVRRC